LHRRSVLLSVVAVVLLGVLSVGRSRLGIAAQDATQPAPVTALAIALDFEPLAASYLPAERLPDSDRLAVAYTVRLPPGGRVDLPAGCRPDGAGHDVLEGGAYAVRSEGPLVVLRGSPARSGGSAEEVPPGQEATVVEGEAVLVLEFDAPLVLRNPGDREALVFGGGAFAPGPLPPPANPAWGTAAGDVAVEVVGAQELPDVGGGPVSVLLARWVLEPGEALVATTGLWPELVWAEAPFDPASRGNPGPEPIEVLTASFHGAD
jgi:hypothetical protein